MYYMIDNYDSFVYNLSAYLKEEGQDTLVRRADEASIEEIYALAPRGLILSPGPRRPADADKSLQILRAFQNQIPILGVCLGHQIIAHAFGAKVCKGQRPMHGKITPVFHDGAGLFAGLPASFEVTRYHSLVVSRENLPACLSVSAVSPDGEIMGLSHNAMPIYGVQFHPEAVLTQFGHQLLANFLNICERKVSFYEAYAGI